MPDRALADCDRLGRRAQVLAGVSVTYNLVEAVIAITAGLVAGSVALVGFGLNSVVEVSSRLAVPLLGSEADREGTRFQRHGR